MTPPVAIPVALDGDALVAAVVNVVREQLERNREWVAPKLALTIAEAAEALSISAPTAYRMARAGDLPTLAIGTKRVVPVAALEEWIAARTNAPTSLRAAS